MCCQLCFKSWAKRFYLHQFSSERLIIRFLLMVHQLSWFPAGLQEPPLTVLCVFCVCDWTGKTFENSEMFGQYPLQVNGFKDLHECLEAAMNEGEIEALPSAENCTRSGQEVSARGAQQHAANTNVFYPHQKEKYSLHWANQSWQYLNSDFQQFSVSH